MEKGPQHLSKECFFGKLAVLMLVVFAAAAIGCEKDEGPIKVGFVGGLTGRLSDLGTAGRDGVILAVEEINGKGGIHGRPIELITKDDKQNPKEALRVDQELLDDGVVAIIGHMTSTMSMAAIPLANNEKILMISPTTSTIKVSGIDDYFIRMLPPNNAETDHLARYASKVLGLKKMAAVYDLSNRDYTEGFFNNFKKEFQRLGGEINTVLTITSGKDTDFVKSAESLLGAGPEGILIVTGARDAAMMSQRIRMKHSKILIFSCGWAMTEDLLHDGGPAVEGLVFSQLFDRESHDPAYMAFKKKFEERFGKTPNFAAALGYEAALVLFKALSENADPRELKTTILRQQTIMGLQGNFKMDKYGDPQRARLLMTVKNGEFKALEKKSK